MVNARVLEASGTGHRRGGGRYRRDPGQRVRGVQCWPGRSGWCCWRRIAPAPPGGRDNVRGRLTQHTQRLHQCA